MEPLVQKILVIGGNGFVGSTVCRTALARGMQVASVSPSGRPWQTPKGHTPGWVHKVEWHQGDALKPETYAHLLPGVTAVVHTIGTLFEKSGYKSAVKDGSVPRLLSSAVAAVAGSGRSANPLEREDKKREGSYALINRDSALTVCKAFIDSQPTVKVPGPRAFVYISAEDCNRPLVPAGYIETKREAEAGIESMVQANPNYRGVYIRPSLIYHPHYRPIISPVAALLDLSATIHSKAPAGFPTPSALLQTLGGLLPRPSRPELTPDSALHAMARALTIPPIHVDHVAEAICIAADNSRVDVRGPYGVAQIRELIGWHQKGQRQVEAHA
ncbi:NAD-P-binding protein [Trametes coccinea BRFM310]|uniref:NAD-P-binding protein n=1 Tax=Trametes coccinea (strain BRFM310) TaxID=1353009 RepID=A0A1Y2I7L4_TRAC3|nr:NAD-P-binding protein [Trametes coccinea BRFM310]